MRPGRLVSLVALGALVGCGVGAGRADGGNGSHGGSPGADGGALDADGRAVDSAGGDDGAGDDGSDDRPVDGGADVIGEAGSFYVSAAGNDTTGDGTPLFPWATLQHAADTIRARHLNGTTDVLIRYSGDLPQTTLVLTDADSGSSAHPVMYRAMSPKDRIMGGKRVTGWQVYSGNVYRAAVTGDFWTMYENGVRGTSARAPNIVVNPDFPEAQEPYFNATGVYLSQTQLQYNPADFDPATWSAADLQVTMFTGALSGKQVWFSDTTPVASIDVTNHVLILAHETKNIIAGGVGGRYFVQGVLDLLDQPGEWYFDRHDVHGSPGAGQHYLYYWPRTNPIANQEIAVPTTQDVIRLVGTDGAHPVHHVVFDQLTIQYSDFGPWFRYGGNYPWPLVILPDVDYWYIEASLPEATHGMVFMTNAEDISITRSHLVDSGFDSIFCYQHCMRMTVQDSWIEHSGYNGIHFEGLQPGKGDVNNNSKLDDDLVNHYGELAFHGAGIWISSSGHHQISHVEIANGQRQGLEFNAGDGTYPIASIYTYGTTVDRAYIHHVCQDSGDTGAIDFVAMSSIAGSGNYAKNMLNQIWIDHAFAHPAMMDAAPTAIFMDSESAGQGVTYVSATNVDTTFKASGTSGAPTPCAYYQSTTCTPAYDPAMMDFAHIGIDKTKFPW